MKTKIRKTYKGGKVQKDYGTNGVSVDKMTAPHPADGLAYEVATQWETAWHPGDTMGPDRNDPYNQTNSPDPAST